VTHKSKRFLLQGFNMWECDTQIKDILDLFFLVLGLLFIFGFSRSFFFYFPHPPPPPKQGGCHVAIRKCDFLKITNVENNTSKVNNKILNSTFVDNMWPFLWMIYKYLCKRSLSLDVCTNPMRHWFAFCITKSTSSTHCS